jgi:hypothetical protein
MRTWSFTVQTGFPESLSMEDAIAERLLEAGCDDGTFYFQNGEYAIDFDRKGSSFIEVALSAMRQIESTGLRVLSILLSGKKKCAKKDDDSPSRRAKLLRIAASIAEAEEEGLYELSEHLSGSGAWLNGGTE